MAIGVLPNEIPVSDERYTLTFDKGGQGKGGKVARFIIDSGKFAGKKVSCSVDDYLFNLLATHLLSAGVETDMTRDNPQFWIACNKEARRIRFEATVLVIRQAAVDDEMIKVPEDYQESNVMVTYHIKDFLPTTAPSDLSTTFKGSF